MDCKFFHCDQKEGEWCEMYSIPRCHNRGGCEYENEGKLSDEDLKNEEIRCKLLQHFKTQVDLSRNWNGLKITDIISWLQSLKNQTTLTEDKKIEEICEYIFKYEHYNSFYQYAVACAKAVAEYKNREAADKASKLLVECIEDFMFKRMEVWNEEDKQQTLENIKRAMTND